MPCLRCTYFRRIHLCIPSRWKRCPERIQNKKLFGSQIFKSFLAKTLSFTVFEVFHNSFFGISNLYQFVWHLAQPKTQFLSRNASAMNHYDEIASVSEFPIEQWNDNYDSSTSNVLVFGCVS